MEQEIERYKSIYTPYFPEEEYNKVVNSVKKHPIKFMLFVRLSKASGEFSSWTEREKLWCEKVYKVCEKYHDYKAIFSKTQRS